MMGWREGSQNSLKIITHRMYTELLTALSTADANAKEAHLLLGQVKEASGTFEKRVLDLEEGGRRLQTEWLDFYDKTHRAMQRIVKRAERADKLEPEINDVELPFNAGTEDKGRFVDPISKRILGLRGIRS